MEEQRETKESKLFRLLKPLIPRPLRPWALRRQETLAYLLIGGLTTLVGFLIYIPLSRWMSILIANVISWIGAVLFAFIMNKAFVFENEAWDLGSVARQGAAFAGMRLLTLGAEELCLFVFSEKLGLNSIAVKVVAQIVVVILNYVFSKRIIFRK